MANKKAKRYTRREFLKYGGKIGFGAALGGSFGNLFGRGYKGARDFYEEDVEPYIQKGKGIIDKTDKIKDNLRNFLKRDNEKYPKPKHSEVFQEEINRRGFLKSILRYSHRHPVTTGTSAGLVYGATKKAVSNKRDYNIKRKIAGIREENDGYKDRIEKLESEVDELKGKTLEDKIKENSLIVLGSFGIIFLLINLKTNITGFLVNETSTQNSKMSIFIILIFSLIFLFIGVHLKFKKK